MAEGIAFGLVKEVLVKLGSALGDEIGLLRSFEDDVRDLKGKLRKIQAVLRNAEERSDVEEENDDLRIWLSELKGAAYDVDDLLDEIRTQADLRKRQRDERNRSQLARKVWDQLLSCANPMHSLKFKSEMAHRMKELKGKIDKIVEEMGKFRLVEGGPRQQAEFKRPETFSVVDKKKVVGRDDDIEKIVKLLLETGGDHDMSVIPIVGMGGLGKTTLAQLAYNDGRVTNNQQRFDLRLWVCVSTDFDIKTIGKAVISAAGETCGDLDNADAIARCLVKIFSQKRFLLVLDDVWNEDQNKWENLKVLFKDGKKGSKILVTTRSKKVADIMRTVELHRVKGLSDDDCWTLFKRRAFKEGEENEYPSLVEIGKQIVRKCGGLPLAANALGGMIRFKSRTEDAWLAIRDSEIWSLKEEKTILPSLKLSYIQMPSALKQCFAYCSIFPKDYLIDKDDLIRQWIALGFVPSHDSWNSMEGIGNDYFNELVWMSFLQDVGKSYRKGSCRMHDLVHDLAQSVARDEVAVIVGEESTRIPEGCRYASIYNRSMQVQVSNTDRQRLRSLQFWKSDSLITTFYSEAKYLRLLDLRYSKISTLPSSIGKLKLLRYLDLSSNNKQELPESITGLYNLQTLKLSWCLKIRTLPNFLGRLVNLRILDLSNCSSLLSLPSSLCDLQHLEKLDIGMCEKLCELPKMIQKLTKLRELINNDCLELKAMPRGISKLVSLRELSLFVVGKQDRVEDCASISELEHLKLVGKLEIKGLENVTNSADAEAANLIEKEDLRSLKLEWEVLSAAEGTGTVPSAEEMESVLENLQPHRNLECLKIKGYGGEKLPSWMMNIGIASCLPNLVTIELANIPRWSSLPPLGQLPFLRELDIRGMPAVTNLGACEFPALTRLSLGGMPALREWVTASKVDDKEGRREQVPTFPRLTNLYLDECPQLRPEPRLPASVEDLTIFGASKENLALILERAMVDSETPLNDGDGDGDGAVSSPLQLPPPSKGLLQYLSIGGCGQVTCLPESLRSLTSLQRLKIWNCEDLERIEDWLGELTDLWHLSITSCESLRYLPAHKMAALKELDIEGCPLLLDAGGRFVDTSVDHVEEVFVDWREYPFEEQVSNSSQEEEASSPKEEKKSWTSCWSRPNWLGSST